jgi:ribonuclease-3
MAKPALNLGYQFRDAALLELALTHPSLGQKPNNQRLEFLGDAVLGMVVAELLYSLYPDEQEGELARRHAALVRGETLAGVARQVALGEALRMTQSESLAGGRTTPSNLEDAMEALIGALYLDGGLDAARDFIHTHWSTLAHTLNAPPKDGKTALQEWAQARGLPVPQYQVRETSGPAHAPVFTVEVRLEGHAPAEGRAASKRLAEQQAAEQLLERLSHG